jgi:hypothetical protein
VFELNVYKCTEENVIMLQGKTQTLFVVRIYVYHVRINSNGYDDFLWCVDKRRNVIKERFTPGHTCVWVAQYFPRSNNPYTRCTLHNVHTVRFTFSA